VDETGGADVRAGRTARGLMQRTERRAVHPLQCGYHRRCPGAFKGRASKRIGPPPQDRAVHGGAEALRRGVAARRLCGRRPQPDAPRLVRLLQARPSVHLCGARRLHPSPAARASAQAGEAAGPGHLPGRSPTLAHCLLRECRAVRASHGLASSETVSMKKPPTGEPYAGKPHVRFGGRGGRRPFPTPINSTIRRSRNTSSCQRHRLPAAPSACLPAPRDRRSGGPTGRAERSTARTPDGCRSTTTARGRKLCRRP
jgi:hypothetical protein